MPFNPSRVHYRLCIGSFGEDFSFLFHKVHFQHKFSLVPYQIHENIKMTVMFQLYLIVFIGNLQTNPFELNKVIRPKVHLRVIVTESIGLLIVL